MSCKHEGRWGVQRDYYCVKCVDELQAEVERLRRVINELAEVVPGPVEAALAHMPVGPMGPPDGIS